MSRPASQLMSSLAVAHEAEYGDNAIEESRLMTLDVNEIWLQVHQRLRIFISRRVSNEAEVDDLFTGCVSYACIDDWIA